MNKVLKVGIATVQEQRARSLAIAAGTRTRDADEPNVWFPPRHRCGTGFV